MAIKREIIDLNQPLTKAQLEELEKAKKMPIVFDEDSPKFSEEQLKKFRRVNSDRELQKHENRKQNVTLRLSPQTIEKAKSLGKGYTSILAAIIENAINDPDGAFLK